MIFIKMCGSVSIAVEVGSIKDLVESVLIAEKCIECALRHGNFIKGTVASQDLHIWNEFSSIPNEGKIVLVPGLANFDQVKKGDIIDKDEKGSIASPVDGTFLFPKYVSTKDKCIVRFISE
jgi:hypothetical protein